MPIRRVLGLDYMSYGTSKNLVLPNWITFDQKNGIIFLEGVAEDSYTDIILLRIYKKDLIVKQFKLLIVDEYE